MCVCDSTISASSGNCWGIGVSGDSLKAIGTTGHVGAPYINNAWKDLYAI